MPSPRNGWTLCAVTPSQYREQVPRGSVRKASWKKLRLTLVLRHNEHRNREGKNIPGRDSMDAEKLTVRSEDEEWTDSARGEDPVTHGDHQWRVSIICSGYNEGFTWAETERHFSVM